MQHVSKLTWAAVIAALALVLPLVIAARPPTAGLNCGQSNRIQGTSGDDAREGTPEEDAIILKEGDDTANARELDDCILGGPGNDGTKDMMSDNDLHGNAGDDLVIGGDGNDVVRGGQGSDKLLAGDGDDHVHTGGMNEGMAPDEVNAGDGDDMIFSAQDGGGDIIRCGEGNDTAMIAPGDQTKDCETTMMP